MGGRGRRLSNERIAFELSTPKPQAVAAIQDRLQRDHGAATAGTSTVLREALRLYGPTFNGHVRTSPGPADGSVRLIHPASATATRTPRFLNGRPDFFPQMESDQPWTVTRPDYHVMRARKATLRLVPDAPVVFDQDGGVIELFSTAYWRLLHFYKGAEARLQHAPRVLDGPALVLMDDIWDINYCHWLSDWLPRVSILGKDLAGVYILTSPIDADYQIETLVACGVRRERIIPMRPWDAVSAPELIVQEHLSDVIHPAFRVANWATSFLRHKLLPTAGRSTALAADRLYVSRADAPGRRIVNEPALITLLTRYDYQAVTLSERPVADQIRLFSQASVVVALHGAGLTNFIFSREDATLVEIFAPTYGTLSFWALANWMGRTYSVYVADRVQPGARTQLDDVEIDLGAFETKVLKPLHG